MATRLSSAVDGVIVDSEVVAERALLAALSSFASRDPLAVILRESFGQSTAAVLERIEHRFGITLSRASGPLSTTTPRR